MPEMNKKVLIITYYWPPSGGPGVQRVLNFAKYLPRYGWEPIILTVQEGEYPAKDFSLVKEIPAHLKIYKTKTFEPFALFKFISGKKQNDSIGTYILTEKSSNPIARISKWIRLNMFIPDARVGWKHFAVKTGEKIIRAENIDLILTSSPPHSLQLIGQTLAQKTKKPWIADYRDPWKEVVYNQKLKRTPWAERKDRRLEHQAINKADGIVSISKDILQLLNSKCDHPQNCRLVYNGYDNTPAPLPANACPTITYTGVLSVTRLPYPLLAALEELRKESVRFHLKFIGNVCPELKSLIEKHGLLGDTEYIPYLPHEKSIEQINQSDVLLLVIDNVPNNQGILTGKLFEYIGAQRPILAIGNLQGEANQIIRECACGEMVDYNDIEGAKRLLRKLHVAWKNRTSPYTFNNNSRYSREATAGELADFMTQILSQHLQKTRQ